ncbi:MAG: DivIVA domain-containing protein [Ilumatobacteraceae bacterium]
MELSPQSVANTSFKTVKKGYDPAEVRSYLESLSKSVESLQSQATAMEARARAAVARLQEIAAQPATQALPATAAEPAADQRKSIVEAHVDEAETISRTLLLAQRTADITIAEAQAEARRITDGAAEEGQQVVHGAQNTADRLVEDAKVDARRAGEGQRIEVESEVQSLLARREFLISDVDHLELHIITQRDRLRDVAAALTDIVAKVPGGLGDIRRPLVSAVEADESTAAADFESTTSSSVMMAADEVSDPVLEALSSSSAVSGLEPDDAVGADVGDDVGDDVGADVGADDEDRVGDSVQDAVGGAELDQIWSGRAGQATDVPAVDEATDSTPDGTPPSGQPNQFLFEDITAEVPAVMPNDPADEMTISGDELR